MKKIFYLFVLFLLLVFPFGTRAAILNLNSSSDTFSSQQNFSVDVKIDSESQGINGVQATIGFDSTILQVVSIEKTNSIFDFWITEPAFDNSRGQIRFIGAATTGYTGKSLQVLKLNLKPKGVGNINLNFSDAVITASDGSGTNVLTKTNGINLNFVIQSGSSTVVTPPVQSIVREPEVASNLPERPSISIILYPDPTKWSNVSDKFFATWKLPSDVTDVAMVLNKISNFIPTVSEGLFESKQFSPLTDGEYYIHARYKNNIDWGPVLHYKISVDTIPPLPVNVSIIEEIPTDSPSPTVTFRSVDSLSGIDHYEVQVDSGVSVVVSRTSYKLPLTPPGKHTLTIKAFDLAGNVAQNTIDFEILPIESPQISFVNNKVYVGEGGLFLGGISLPDSTILIALKQKTGELVSENSVAVDGNGTWQITIDQPLKTGNYIAEVRAQDSRGALSFPVESSLIQVINRPVIQIGSLQIDAPGAIVVLIIILLAGFIGGIWFYRIRQGKLDLRVGLAQSDIGKIFGLISSDIDNLYKALKTDTPGDDEYAWKRVRENIGRMESYIKKGVEKIRK